jgi:hypothetical protein
MCKDYKAAERWKAEQGPYLPKIDCGIRLDRSQTLNTQLAASNQLISSSKNMSSLAAAHNQ